jgi:hypothetical protein
LQQLLRTQAVFCDDQLEVRVVLAQFDDQALGGIALGVINDLW